jgi:NAD(P)-dependent dehydrogenase (short-subunit alcohol dehydrogenase family)
MTDQPDSPLGSTGLRLEGKVALCTGAGRRGGLGEAICKALALEGCAVTVSDIEGAGASELEAIVSEIKAQGGRAQAAALDVRDEGQVERVIAASLAAFNRFDILVNNAGIGFHMQPLTQTRKETWEQVLDVNLMGAFLCTKHAALRMMEQGSGGRIINIASQAAKSGHAHLAAYSSSKHGMVGLTRSAAIELGPYGITVNALCPNHVTTGLGAVQNEYFSKLRGFANSAEYLEDMKKRIPLRRVGLTSDTAHACVFLCSEAAAYITGEAINVSGGMEMH